MIPQLATDEASTLKILKRQLFQFAVQAAIKEGAAFKNMRYDVDKLSEHGNSKLQGMVSNILKKGDESGKADGQLTCGEALSIITNKKMRAEVTSTGLLNEDDLNLMAERFEKYKDKILIKSGEQFSEPNAAYMENGKIIKGDWGIPVNFKPGDPVL